MNTILQLSTPYANPKQAIKLHILTRCKSCIKTKAGRLQKQPSV